MYPNYINDRKSLGYECLMDTQCGNRLVLITDSSVVFVKNVSLNVKHRSNRIIFVSIVVITLLFSDVKSAEAMGTNPRLQQTIVNIVPDRDASRLIQPSKIKINSDIEPKIMMPSLSKSIGSVRIRTKSDLRNSQWIKEFVSGIRGGDNEKLIKSIISKVSEADWDIPSINKILKKLAEVTLEIGTNDKLLRILAELEKPIPQSSIFVEGWVNPLPRHRKLNEVDKPKCSSPSIEFLLDSTKCYGHREAYNMPRSVSERFETNAVKKLYKTSLKNPRLKKEYKAVKDLFKEGVHPVNLSKKSTYVSPTKVLVKKPEGRYLVDVSDTNVEIVGVSSRTNDKCMSKFETLMNELYNLDLKGY